ncbi:conserved hypothetical protein [Novosphingobium sp. KN65.2]|nr:conserved hypothetical protein [Novosphingobium sp. KN65.2]
MSLAVVGARHLNADNSNRQFEILMCEPGEPIDLIPEPTNTFDQRAVAVFSCRGVQIGYLTAERCGRIGQLIREGREVQAVFQRQAQFGAWIRIAFDGEVPIVSVEEPVDVSDRNEPGGVDADPDFYPDEVWPDD